MLPCIPSSSIYGARDGAGLRVVVEHGRTWLFPKFWVPYRGQSYKGVYCRVPRVPPYFRKLSHWGRWSLTLARFSPVADFREARCRAFHEHLGRQDTRQRALSAPWELGLGFFGVGVVRVGVAEVKSASFGEGILSDKKREVRQNKEK